MTYSLMIQGVSKLQKGGPVLTSLPYSTKTKAFEKTKATNKDRAAQWHMVAACPYGVLTVGSGRRYRAPAGQ